MSGCEKRKVYGQGSHDKDNSKARLGVLKGRVSWRLGWVVVVVVVTEVGFF